MTRRLQPYHVLLFFVAFLVSGNVVFSQSVIVRGVVTADKEAASLGSATVFSLPDSTLVKGTYLDSNKFELVLNSKVSKSFYLRLTVPGYSDTTINFKTKDSLVDLKMIVLEKNEALETVEVLYQREVFKRTLDGITVNVDGTSLQLLTNLFEVLKASPKITSPDEEAIEIIGRGRPLILVDRQPILSNDELRAIPANQIEKIEIITNPSAKYKAQGSSNGVIEVYTKNFHLEGYNATVRSLVGVNTRLNPTGSLNLGLSLKKKKFSLNGYLGGNYDASEGFMESNGEATDGTERSLVTNSNFESENRWQYYNIKAAYEVSKNQRLTMGLNGYGSNGENTSESVTSFSQNQALLTERTGENLSSWTWASNSAFLNYNIETDTNKSNFEINLNYTNKVSGNDNYALTAFQDAISNQSSRFNIRNDSRDVPNVGELRINYEHVFDTTGWKLGVGMSYSLLINGKKLDRFGGDKDNWIRDEAQSNSYDYTENIGAAFLEVTKNWDDFSFRVGIRAEYTNLNGYSNSLQQEFIDSVYILPFPSASLMWQANPKAAFTLFYDSGINRPQFDNFDPFIVQSDSFSIDYGNPFLRPAIEHSFGIDIDLFYKYNISVSYNFVAEPISSISFIDNNSFLTETTPWNAKAENGVNVSLSIPLQTKWLRGWNSIYAGYTRYSFTPIFEREPLNNLTYGIYSYLTFILPKDFELTNRVTIQRWGGSTQIQQPMVRWGLRARKKFKGNKFQLFADVGNIFPPKYKSERFSGNYNYNTVSQDVFTTFQLGFFAKFGRLKQADQIKESKSGQSDRI